MPFDYTKKLNNPADYPTVPADETAARQQFMDLFDGIRDAYNGLEGVGRTTETVKGNADAIALKANKVQEGLSALTLVNGWTISDATQYYKDEFGIVHVSGKVTGGTTTSGTTLFTLGAGDGPGSFIFRNSVTFSTAIDAMPCILQIDPNGIVTLAFASKTTIVLDFSFRI